MQAHAKGDRHGGHGYLSIIGQTLGNRAEQDERRVAEYRDGNEVAGNGKPQCSVLLASDFQDGFGHGFSGSGLFQQGARDSAQRNNQADIRHGATHAAGKGGKHILHPHTGDDSENYGSGNQGEERMDLELNRADNQDDNGQDQAQDHKCVG